MDHFTASTSTATCGPTAQHYATVYVCTLTAMRVPAAFSLGALRSIMEAARQCQHQLALAAWSASWRLRAAVLAALRVVMTDCSAAAAPLPCCSSHCSSRRLPFLADLQPSPQELVCTQCQTVYQIQMSAEEGALGHTSISMQRVNAMVTSCSLCVDISAQQVGKVLLQRRSYVGNCLFSVCQLQRAHADLAFAGKALQSSSPRRLGYGIIHGSVCNKRVAQQCDRAGSLAAAHLPA
jgi:hypothetical protein